MADPYEQVAVALKTIIDTEFAPENVSAIHDYLHGSLGTDAVWVGISPERWRPVPRDRNTLETYALVQYYDIWDKEIDPTQQVNPIKITNLAARFSQALQQQQAAVAGTEDVWYFDVEGIEFPNDPTDNKTRFHATVRAYGNNHSILESMA